MDKLEYITGDLVYFESEKAKVEFCNPSADGFIWVRVIENGGENRIWNALLKNEISPIPLTKEILEKNGWKKEVMSRGTLNKHWIYTKPDIKEYGYFPIYIEKGIGKEFDVYPFTDNNVCTQIAYIKHVHQLQHLLFGLGLNSEMEV